MNYKIPQHSQDIIALRHKPVDEEVVAAAIAGVINISRSQGQSLDDLKEEILADDGFLDASQRSWLSHVLAEAWHCSELGTLY
ncbi:hypothetical protein PN466_15270 [Roseofilum reptotaenium CS-1145]|uniref:Uncharacterized protein n=1 Tax=Roseofilum reptotaenium AO1-A TaxID=1925591 RepID=A0A1L9QSE0_9CYAN|nr:hypothetical protein [Roseofilum reptotaenium]MDB9518304.1 hypothetical protein [Roseofilum reptotaenium CS-1145]OJJ25497.1 hypothetical protein BI308_11020 [Roseofilum reptotaenium AO1-A]